MSYTVTSATAVLGLLEEVDATGGGDPVWLTTSEVVGSLTLPDASVWATLRALHRLGLVDGEQLDGSYEAVPGVSMMRPRWRWRAVPARQLQLF